VADYVGKCEFVNAPVGVGSFWDPSCKAGGVGCDADGIHPECRLCGTGDFASVPCPPSSCKFQGEPSASYFWDNECTSGKLGCWADGIHAQCRFCGEAPYTSILCPEGAARASPTTATTCTFETKPDAPYYLDPGCEAGMHGCNADGVNVHCRFCGRDSFADIPCPASHVCQLDPSVPHYWDPQCEDGMLGCNADGVHVECRYCEAAPYEEVSCPASSHTLPTMAPALRR